MQRRARPVCSGSGGPGAGSQLASVSEIRAGDSGGGHWTNTRRPPQSSVLYSARGDAGRALTRRRADAGWEGRGPYPAQGLRARLRGLSAWACERAGAGR